jgi:hypothetical protein
MNPTMCDVRDLRSEIAKWFGIGWLSIAKKSIREFEKRYGLIPRRETAARLPRRPTASFTTTNGLTLRLALMGENRIGMRRT